MNLVPAHEPKKGFSNQTIARRLAWAVHEDQELIEQLCAAHKKEYYDTRRLVDCLRYEIENVKRFCAMESLIKDPSRYQNEYSGLGTLCFDDRGLNQVTAENAERVMKGMDWRVLIRNHEVFEKHGLKPQVEVARQMKFEDYFSVEDLKEGGGIYQKWQNENKDLYLPSKSRFFY
jgi:hypothetical protein